jgi:hypothetical protein
VMCYDYTAVSSLFSPLCIKNDWQLRLVHIIPGVLITTVPMSHSLSKLLWEVKSILSSYRKKQVGREFYN